MEMQFEYNIMYSVGVDAPAPNCEVCEGPFIVHAMYRHQPPLWRFLLPHQDLEHPCGPWATYKTSRTASMSFMQGYM